MSAIIIAKIILLLSVITVNVCQRGRKPFLMRADFENGKRLPESFLASLSGLFFEDTPIQMDVRNVQIDQSFKWPKGRIPYVISGKYATAERAVIARAFDEYHNKTGITFIYASSDDRDYIEITPDDGKESYCYSLVGRQRGRQFVKMFGECLRVSAMVHELGHAIGLAHEHQRPDRDHFIAVNLTNVDEAYWHDFEKESPLKFATLEMSYDFRSVMHYPSHAFSKNGEPSIAVISGSADITNENYVLSESDVNKIQLYYGS